MPPSLEPGSLELHELFDLLSQPTRLRVLFALAESGEQCVTQLSRALALRQCVASHHLGALAEFGLVVRRRACRHVFYALTDDYRGPGRHVFQVMTRGARVTVTRL